MEKSYNIVDQRTNPRGKSLPNRQRFLTRQKQQVREAVAERIKEGNITDLATGADRRIKLRSKRLDEPTFHHGKGGVNERVLPGNKKFQTGDRIERPDQGDGDGNEGSPDGEGEDDFYFELGYDEWLNELFEGMEIPNQIKKSLAGADQFELRRAGFQSDGPPNKMDLARTKQRSIARRYAFRAPHIRAKHALEKELRELEQVIANANGREVSREQERIVEIHAELEILQRKIKRVPFLDTFDLRYRRHEFVPIPVTKAVMFCMLDVSGSMGEWEKEMAKRFYVLLYLFLQRNYEKVEIVFIRHTTEAKEVTEVEFFTSRESGGTVVSSALELMKMIVEARYPIEEWNIYGCHASDGDNTSKDNARVFELMEEFILPASQYYAYIEVRAQGDGELWPVYGELLKDNENLAINHIRGREDIYPVFRKLFTKGWVTNE